MTQPLICHLLIGLPASGKSTFAQVLAGEINGLVVSTDTIRAQLYGDEAIQGNWAEIEANVLSQIRTAVTQGRAVIYDGTNAAHPWRLGFLHLMADLKNVRWIGWYLKTPVKICKERNRQRHRQVSDEVIDKMNAYLQESPPDKIEGMLAVYPLEFTNNGFELAEIRQKIKGLNRVLTNRANLNKKKKFHQYSRLLDFERLMHLISVIINYPGIGNLAETEPEILRGILKLEELPEFNSSIEEVCAVIAKKYHSLYADTEAIKKDLNWLKKNQIIGGGDVSADLVDMDLIKDDYLVSHRYDEIEQFERLIKTIRFLLYLPFLCEENGKPSLLIKEGKRVFRQTSVVKEMSNYNVFNIEINNKYQRSPWENNFREDICYCIKPYQLLPEFDMKKGYFAGTAIFSKSELNKIFQLLQSQSQQEYFQDPVAGDVYDTFQKRMIDSHLLEGDEPYPIRVIGTKSIVNVEKHTQKFEGLEKAIKKGELLELSYLPGSAKWTTNRNLKLKVYPLQIVFHNIAWYLGYEIEEGENNGLLAFERIDRIKLKNVQSQRIIKQQKKSLDNLSKLYIASAGLYLGDDVKKQQSFLKNSKERKKLEVRVLLYATELSFKFICEGTQRFHKIKMSVPDWFEGLNYDRQLFNLPENIPPYKYRIEITVPEWSLKDIDLIRWISGWGREVRVIEPQQLIQTIKAKGEEIEEIYRDIDLLVCNLEKVNDLMGTKRVETFISIMNTQGTNVELELVENRKTTNYERVLQLKLDSQTILSQEYIEKAVDFIKRIYKKSNNKVNPRILVYSHSRISLASDVAIAIYTALRQDRELAGLTISLSYL